MRTGVLAAQEVEVAALVGLEHVVKEQAAVAPRVVGRPRLPLRAAAGQLVVGHAEGEPAVGHVQLDLVAVLHVRERPARLGLGRDVQGHRPVRRPAHARVGDAHHVAHALLQELARDRRGAPLGMPGAPFGPTRLSTSTDVSSTSRSGSSMRACRSASFSNTTARPRCVSARADIRLAPVRRRRVHAPHLDGVMSHGLHAHSRAEAILRWGQQPLTVSYSHSHT